MTYDLYIGDRSYSSWSLRGWLMLEEFDLQFQCHDVGLYGGTLTQDLAHLAPARTVPVLSAAGGIVLSDSLAMGEALAEAHPEIPFYPKAPAARALARSIVAEMHSGYAALRSDCPMNLRNCWQGFEPSAAVRKDVARIELLWQMAREKFGAAGPWLFGSYSLADVFHAPIAARFAGYGLASSKTAKDYVAAHLNSAAFRRWRATALTEVFDAQHYQMPLKSVAWPGPKPKPAIAVDGGTAENATCPYSGRPVTHLADFDGRIFGFCNKTCRDKTVNDPEVWPKFNALLTR